jgi:hypothetical protein
MASRLLCLDERINVFVRAVNGKRYRVASQSVWDPVRKRPFARQAILGPADPPPTVDLGNVRTTGKLRIGDVGALVWVAEQLDLIRIIDDACGLTAPAEGPTLGELVLAVAVQRGCAPGAKRRLATFLETCLPRVSCLSAATFTGQEFHRRAAQVSGSQLEKAQIEIARGAVERFQLSASVLAFDTTNFDTHIATTTPGELARRGHAKSKRSDLRVVGLATLVSETDHVPLLHRTYPGNGSDQGVLGECLEALSQLHDALGQTETGGRCRTVVRDGGSWSEQLELDLHASGYGTLISLPLSHGAAEEALRAAAQRGAMQGIGGALEGVRAARVRARVGKLDRTLVVVESKELLRGQKRGIAAALTKAKEELSKLERRAARGRIGREELESRVQKALRREHLWEFVVATVEERAGQIRLRWHVDAAQRRRLERTRLGRRVLCTDRHFWSTGRIVQAFRGQWKVEELFRRAKKGGVVAWGPSHQWADSSLRLHTFATVIGLMLVSLARRALGTKTSAQGMMQMLREIEATEVGVRTAARGRRARVLLAPDLSDEQRNAVQVFDLERWLPSLLSSRQPSASKAIVKHVA